MFDWLFSWFRESATEAIFLSIAVAGALFSAFSLLFGGDVDADGDFDVDHDGGDGHGYGPGVLSIRGLSLLATGFGAVAYIVYHYTNLLLVSSVSGILSGWVFAFIMLALVRVFFQQQASSLVTANQIPGTTGMVTTAIPAGGCGEVRLTVAGRQVTRTASTEGDPLPLGTLVRVVRYMGGVAVVKQVSATEAEE